MAVIVYIYCGQMPFVVKITRQSDSQAFVVCGGGRSVGGEGASECGNAAIACAGGRCVWEGRGRVEVLQPTHNKARIVRVGDSDILQNTLSINYISAQES